MDLRGAVETPFTAQYPEPESRTMAGIQHAYNMEEMHLDRFMRSVQSLLDTGYLYQMSVAYSKDTNSMKRAMLAVGAVTDNAIVDMRTHSSLRSQVYERVGITIGSRKYKENTVPVGPSFSPREGVYLVTTTDYGPDQFKRGMGVSADVRYETLRGFADFMATIDLYWRYEMEKERRGHKRFSYDAMHDILHHTSLSSKSYFRAAEDAVIEREYKVDKVYLQHLLIGIQAAMPRVYVMPNTDNVSARYRNIIHMLAPEPLSLIKPPNRATEISEMKNSALYWNFASLRTDDKEFENADSAQNNPQQYYEGDIPSMTTDQINGKPLVLGLVGTKYTLMNLPEENKISEWAVPTVFWSSLVRSPGGLGVLRKWLDYTARTPEVMVMRDDHVFPDGVNIEIVYIYGGHDAGRVIAKLSDLLRVAPVLHKRRAILTPRWYIDVDAMYRALAGLVGQEQVSTVADSMQWQLSNAYRMPLYDERLADLCEQSKKAISSDAMQQDLWSLYHNTSEGVPLDTHDMLLAGKNENKIVFPRGTQHFESLMYLYSNNIYHIRDTTDEESTVFVPRELQLAEEQLDISVFNLIKGPLIKLIMAKMNKEDPSAPSIDFDATEASALLHDGRKTHNTLSGRAARWRPDTVFTHDPWPLSMLGSERASTLWLSHLMRPAARKGDDDANATTRKDVSAMFSDTPYYHALYGGNMYSLWRLHIDNLLRFTEAFMDVVLVNDFIRYNPSLPTTIARSMHTTKSSQQAGVYTTAYYMQQSLGMFLKKETYLPLMLLPEETSRGGQESQQPPFYGTWVSVMKILFFDPLKATIITELIRAPAKKLATVLKDMFITHPIRNVLQQQNRICMYLLERIYSTDEAIGDRYADEINAIMRNLPDYYQKSTFAISMLWHYLRISEYAVVRYVLGFILPVIHDQLGELGRLPANAVMEQTPRQTMYNLPCWFLTARASPFYADDDTKAGTFAIRSVYRDGFRVFASGEGDPAGETVQTALMAEDNRLLGGTGTNGGMYEHLRRWLGIERRDNEDGTYGKIIPHFLEAMRMHNLELAVANAARGRQIHIYRVFGPYLICYVRQIELKVQSGEAPQGLYPSYKHGLYFDLRSKSGSFRATVRPNDVGAPDVGDMPIVGVIVTRWRI